MMLSLLIYASRSGRTRSKTTKFIASIVIAGCLLQFYNAAFDTSSFFTPPSSSTIGIDYEHYVPSHRFLLVDDGTSSSASATAEDGEEKKKFQWKGPQKITLKPRSKEEVINIRRRANKAIEMRRLGITNEEELYASLTPELKEQILNTANALSIPSKRQVNVTSYDIDSTLLAARMFQRELLFFIYDSATDDFVIMHNTPKCNWGCKRVYIIAPVLAAALRKNYPSRFQGAESGDLVFLLSTGDMPRIRRPCLFETEGKGYCKSTNWAPILQFGSILVDSKYMPSVIAMPQSPRPHIPCISEYQSSGKICQDLQPRQEVVEGPQDSVVPQGQDPQAAQVPQGQVAGVEAMGKHFQDGLVYAENIITQPNYWDNLIPQVIWRGTDFLFLHTLFPDMRSPTYEEDIKPYEGQFGVDESESHPVVRGAIKSLWNMGQDKLTPRWRGVLLTSEAELEARHQDAVAGVQDGTTLPWVNIKFASCNVNGKKMPASDNPEFQLLQETYGINAIGNSMNMMEHAKYKYHIDLGGGGGTTWTGTIEKLALPGVLFHHVTPTKDWYHDHLEPWVHYIPVAVDLSDLKAKYDWAESHPQETQRIAEAGTEFARRMGSLEGYAQLYQEHIVHPLGKIIAAYKMPRKKYHGAKVLDVLKQANENYSVVARCGGWPSESTKCRWVKKDNEMGGGAEESGVDTEIM